MAIKDPDFKVNSSDLHYAQHIASLARLKFSQFNPERYNTKKGGMSQIEDAFQNFHFAVAPYFAR